MKNKIKRFAKGDFHIPQPDIIFPETRIVMRVGEGEKYRGSFSLQNQGEGTIRGLVYPSSYRVVCDEQGFDGNPVNIYYTYDGTGLVPGHVEHGKFTIVCNGGEYDIAFTAIIEKPYVMTSYGKVQSLEDFKKLSFQDAAEAVKLFRSRDFYEILKYEDRRIRLFMTICANGSWISMPWKNSLWDVSRKKRFSLHWKKKAELLFHFQKPGKKHLP